MTNYKELLALSEITKEDEIFDYFDEGQITDVVIFTAYLDIQTLVDFRDFLNKNGQKWPNKNANCKNCNVRIFTDSSNKRLLDQLSSQEKRNYSWIEDRYIKESKDKFCFESGIYFVNNSFLFHPKCYLFTYANGASKILFGSMNFTQNGRRSKNKKGNEEFLLSLSTNTQGQMQIARNLKDDIYLYLKNNSEHNIVKYKKGTAIVKTNSLRDLFLDGFLWYKMEETDSLFRMPIKMSKEELKQPTKYYAIDDQHSQSYNIKKVIEKKFRVNLTSETSKNKTKIKIYFLATSIGQWSPKKYREIVEDILFEKEDEKKKEVKKLKEIFANNFEMIQEEVLEDIKKHPQWKITKKKIEKRLKILKSKLLSEEDGKKYNSYCKRLISPWISYPMVDIWNDSLAVKEFENSLDSELQYKLQKERKIPIIRYFTEQEEGLGIESWELQQAPVETLKKYCER